MKAATAADLLSATRLPQERLDLPELDMCVFVRGMSGKQRDAFEISLRKGPQGQRRNLDNFRARLAAECLVTDDGARLFTAEQVQALGDVRADVLTKIVAVAQRLSGISEEDAEELGKPSAPGVGAGSSSSSL